MTKIKKMREVEFEDRITKKEIVEKINEIIDKLNY